MSPSQAPTHIMLSGSPCHWAASSSVVLPWPSLVSPLRLYSSTILPWDLVNVAMWMRYIALCLTTLIASLDLGIITRSEDVTATSAIVLKHAGTSTCSWPEGGRGISSPSVNVGQRQGNNQALRSRWGRGSLSHDGGRTWCHRCLWYPHCQWRWTGRSAATWLRRGGILTFSFLNAISYGGAC